MQLRRVEGKFSDLVLRYPFLYQIDEWNDELFGRFGFECGEGWFGLLDRLSAKLTELFSDLPHEDWPRVVQVKEKFSTLRYYIDYPVELTKEFRSKIDSAVAVAEAESAKTCEVCGNAGRRHGGGWLITLCDLHAQARRDSGRECIPLDEYGDS